MTTYFGKPSRSYRRTPKKKAEEKANFDADTAARFSAPQSAPQSQADWQTQAIGFSQATASVLQSDRETGAFKPGYPAGIFIALHTPSAKNKDEKDSKRASHIRDYTPFHVSPWIGKLARDCGAAGTSGGRRSHGSIPMQLQTRTRDAFDTRSLRSPSEGTNYDSDSDYEYIAPSSHDHNVFDNRSVTRAHRRLEISHPPHYNLFCVSCTEYIQGLGKLRKANPGSTILNRSLQ
ncbi:hypothetical protein DFH09DRAFT_1069103 [Mycena vulgaris]|nr:hypothetical protein DFH09DRAFT_1069103 [Mycena vulgaris]